MRGLIKKYNVQELLKNGLVYIYIYIPTTFSQKTVRSLRSLICQAPNHLGFGLECNSCQQVTFAETLS